MQIEVYDIDGTVVPCPIPDANEPILHDVFWGDVDRVFTPAFWRFVYLTRDQGYRFPSYRLGNTLEQEVAACLLGGHGIIGELSDAAFSHLREAGIFSHGIPTEEDLRALLSQPLSIHGRPVHYRFPAQKARYIASALRHLRETARPTGTPRELRDWLLAIPGIGLKTASWIVRNWIDAADVAILDIHIHRAGVLAELFNPNDDVVRDYRSMEDRFIRFADGIEVPANILDSVIWHRLRRAPTLVRRRLVERGVRASDRCGLPPAHDRRTSGNYDLFANA